MEPEKWKPTGVTGYEVSDQGRVRSLSRRVKCAGSGTRLISSRILKPFAAKQTGYMQVELSGARWSIHRVVAEAWCDGRFDGAVVDHINADKTDNRAVNLRWVTHSENQKASYRFGRQSPPKGKFSSLHPTAKPVMSRCLTTGIITKWSSAMDAVRCGFDSSGIAHCCTGRFRSHKGHEWRHGVEWSDPAISRGAA